MAFNLPPLDKLFPFSVLVQVAPKNIISVDRRLLWNMEQVHVDFPQLAAALAMVAGRTGGNYIGPDMLSTQVFGQDMVHRQFTSVTPAVLAGVVITAKDLPAGQLDLQAWTVDHLIQADDGWPRQG